MGSTIYNSPPAITIELINEPLILNIPAVIYCVIGGYSVKLHFDFSNYLPQSDLFMKFKIQDHLQAIHPTMSEDIISFNFDKPINDIQYTCEESIEVGYKAQIQVSISGSDKDSYSLSHDTIEIVAELEPKIQALTEFREIKFSSPIHAVFSLSCSNRATLYWHVAR